jgi:hypothetical protein
LARVCLGGTHGAVVKRIEAPYVERRLIVVADDEVVLAEREAKEKAKKEGTKINWVDLAINIVSMNVVGVAGQAPEIYRSIQNMRENGFPVLTIGRTESTELEFPIGHPRYKVLYVGHPAVPTSYIPMGDFHRFLFEHKIAEAFSLLMALGAQELEIERISGNSSLIGLSAAVPVPIEGVKGSGEFETHRKATSEI